MQVTVLAGQSYADIAAQYLGDASLVYLIQSDGQAVDLNHAPGPGQILTLPDPSPDKVPLVDHLKDQEPIATRSGPGIGSRMIGISLRIS